MSSETERVLDMLAQAAIVAEKIGAVAVEVRLMDEHGAGIVCQSLGPRESVQVQKAAA